MGEDQYKTLLRVAETFSSEGYLIDYKKLLSIYKERYLHKDKFPVPSSSSNATKSTKSS